MGKKHKKHKHASRQEQEGKMNSWKEDICYAMVCINQNNDASLFHFFFVCFWLFLTLALKHQGSATDRVRKCVWYCSFPTRYKWAMHRRRPTPTSCW